MRYNIFRIVLYCFAIIIIFGYTIMAEEDEEERNASINFNQMPNVGIKPINDKINKTTDGAVELFADNPSSNQFPLQVDFISIVSQGITLYSDELSLVEKPDAFIAGFQVMPGQKKEILIKVKSNKIGNYSVEYNEVYYPVGNQHDNVKNIVLNYIVEEPSIINKSISNAPINVTNNTDIDSNTSSAYIDNNDTNDTTIPATKKIVFVPIGSIIAILILVFYITKFIQNK